MAIAAGVIFILAGLVKFVFHHWELRAFRAFGLPWPSALEILAGLLEVAGGVLLLARVAVRPAALLLGATMVVAIGASGIGHGDVIPSLTLAPALLVAMVFLLARTARASSSGQPGPRGRARGPGGLGAADGT
ncbi:MAG: DoxX family protein [Solirubrobacteraceae bacterium]